MNELPPDAWAAAIQDMSQRVREINTANGWFDRTRTFGDDIALLHSEVSEAFEAYRNWSFADATSRSIDLSVSSMPKPEGVGSELADVLVRLLDTCSRYDVDLVSEFFRKLQYNDTRSYRHGNKNL